MTKIYFWPLTPASVSGFSMNALIHTTWPKKGQKTVDTGRLALPSLSPTECLHAGIVQLSVTWSGCVSRTMRSLA